MYAIFATLFNVFDKHREKYAKLDLVKFISLGINCFVGTGCFVFKKYRHASLFLFPSSNCQAKRRYREMYKNNFIHFSFSSLSQTVTARFLGQGRDKA